MDESTSDPPPLRSARDAFTAFINELFKAGTHPAGTKGPGRGGWTRALFSRATEDEYENREITAQAVGNILRGESLPDERTETFLRILFGDDFVHAEKKQEFLTKLEAACKERDADTTRIRANTKRIRTAVPKTMSGYRPLCLGRSRDIANLVNALTDGRATAHVILGRGGIGKTTLAVSAATEKAVIDRFGDRRWQVTLTTAMTANDVQAAIAQTLGYDPAQTKFSFVLEKLRTLVRQKPGLLLLDNLETPWDEDRKEVRKTLKELHAIDNLVLIATLLGYDPPDSAAWVPHSIQRLKEGGARELFLSHASIHKDDPLLDTFLSELLGWPLLIQLVARRARNHPDLQELWAEWQEHGSLVAVDRNAEEDRHTSIEHVVFFSWKSSALGDPARKVFRLLGQLPAGSSSDDLKELAGEKRLEAAEQLVASGLAEWRDRRLDLLSPVRHVARSRLQPNHQDMASWVLHYLGLAKDCGARVRRADAKHALARLSPEISNIDAAFSAAETADLLETAGAAAEGFGQALRTMGFGATSGLRLAAEACVTSKKPFPASQCLVALGVIAILQIDYQAARMDFNQAIALAGDASNDLEVAHCLRGYAELDLMQYQWPKAREGYEAAKTRYEQIGDDLGVAHCLRGCADLDRLQGQWPKAREGYEAAKTRYEQIGDDLGIANCLRGCADLDRLQGQWLKAREGYEAAKTRYEQIGDDLGVAHCLRGCAELDALQCQWPKAREGYEAAKTRYEQIGDDLGVAHCLRGYAELDLIQNQWPKAREGYEAAKTRYEQIGDDLGIANCLRGCADLDYMQNQWLKAREGYEAAKTRYEQIGNDLGVAHCLRGYAELDLMQNQWFKAREGYEAAKTRYEQIGDDLGIANCLRGCADLDRLQGQWLKAREGYEAAKTRYEQIGSDLGLAHCLRGCADLDRLQGQWPKAREGYEAAKTRYEQIGDDLGVAHCLVGCAEHAEHIGQNAEALQVYMDAKILFTNYKMEDWVNWIDFKMILLAFD